MRELATSSRRKPDKLSAYSMISFGWGYLCEVTLSLRLSARRWQMDDGSSMSAAVAYYLALSLFPMLLLLTSGLGLFLKFTNLGHDAERQLLSVVAEHCSPALEGQIHALLVQFEDQSLVSGPFGLVTAVMAAIGVFYQFERAFDKIWRIPRPSDQGIVKSATRVLTKRLAAFVMLTSVGLAIVAIMIANVAISAFQEWMTHLSLPGAILITAVDATATMGLNCLAFGILYRFLPKRRVLWSDAFRSGLLVAIVWEVGMKFLVNFLVATSYTTTYGAIGSFIGLLLWFYWGVTILFFGAEYLQVLSQMHARPLRMFQPNDESQEGPNFAGRIAPRRAA